MNPNRKSIWLGPWDVVGGCPEALLDKLRDLGVEAAALALAYHGGRLLLGSHPSRVVYELPRSALYFRVEAGRFSLLAPVIAGEADAAHAFLTAASRRGFPVEGWLVLCHNDLLPAEDPSLAVCNAFGETYSHALCPANPRVADYCVELCRQVARLEGVVGLDLEALSFMGYDHASLHDKRAEVKSEIASLLSVCLCACCREKLNGAAGELERHIRCSVRALLCGQLTEPMPTELETALLAHRAKVQRELLERIREATRPAHLNLRLAGDRRSTGGKCSLLPEEIEGLVDEGTLTFFGLSLAELRRRASAIKATTLPLRAGIVFHGPDCLSYADLRERALALSGGSFRGVSFYSYSLAQPPHFGWLRELLRGGSTA